jgi:cell pole-organizing protein PopZ
MTPERESQPEPDVLELADLAEIADSEDEAPQAEAPLLDDDARVSMQQSFAALAMLAEPGAQPQIVRSGETSLEGLARELLRPALAEWLDRNLPPLVERMVAAEIARIVGKKA